MHKKGNETEFTIDFEGKALPPADAGAKLTADVGVPEDCRITHVNVQPNPVSGGWRLVFRVKSPRVPVMEKILPEKKKAGELRAALKQDGRILTEIWSFAIEPPK